MPSARPYSIPRATWDRAEGIPGSGSVQTGWSGAAATLAVIAGSADFGLHLQHHALDRHHPHPLAGVDRCGAAGASAPKRVTNSHDAVGIDVLFGPPHLPD